MDWHPSRRLFLTSGLATIAAPAIVRATSLMPVRAWRGGVARRGPSIVSLQASLDGVTWKPVSANLGPGALIQLSGPMSNARYFRVIASAVGDGPDRIDIAVRRYG